MTRADLRKYANLGHASTQFNREEAGRTSGPKLVDRKPRLGSIRRTANPMHDSIPGRPKRRLHGTGPDH